MGDATVASAQKGDRIFSLAVERLLALTIAYRKQPIRDYRHFERV